jgi:hypothetical protein
MSVQQKNTLLIRIMRSIDGYWNVLENDYEEPLAAFTVKQDACDYANKLSMERKGSTVIVLDEAIVWNEKNQEGARTRL